MLGPVLIQFGTEEQKKRFLPRAAQPRRLVVPGLLRAGRRVRPRQPEDRGEARRRPLRRERPEDLDLAPRTMPTGASCLVRTNPNAAKRQEGISFLLVDMKTPGITVRPIISIDGSHHLNEVFFDDVKVPVENLRRRGEQGLGRRQVPAGQRTHRHRPARQVEGARALRQGGGARGPHERQAADRGPAISAPASRRSKWT